MGLLQGKLSEALRTLNNIRNRVAHNLGYEVTQDDLQLLARFEPTLTRKEQWLVNKLGSPKKELIFFCVYFAGYAPGFVAGRRSGFLRALREARNHESLLNGA